MLTKPEIYKIVKGYIGVKEGYLGDFNYRSHEEFYPYYCEVDIFPSAYEGTTRERFISILETADNITQAKILKGVLKKYPVKNFPDSEQERKQLIAEQIEEMIRRLDKSQTINHEKLVVTNDVVERAIGDAKILIEKNGATSGVDRIHTALHGYLKEVSKKEGIMFPQDATLTQIFKKLKASHPALQTNSIRQIEIDQIINSFSNILDKLNPIRNQASLSHPNEELLDEDEAVFVINAAQTVLNYLNRKFKS